MSDEPEHRDVVLRLIGVFKLVKAAALVAIGIGALSMIGNQAAREWIANLAKDVENKHLVAALSSVSSIDEHKLREIGIVGFGYAALFTVEGLGLILRKVWAEYVTIAITTSFVPLEIYELVEKVSIAKTAVTIANLAIIAYLVWKLRRDHKWPFKRH